MPEPNSTEELHPRWWMWTNCFVPLGICLLLLAKAYLFLRSRQDNPPGIAYAQLMGSLSFHLFTCSAAIMAVWDIVYFFYCNTNCERKKLHQQIRQTILGVWLLGPPLYFILEWWKFYQGPYSGDEFEIFKIGQDLATKLWAAIFVMLAGLHKDWS
jgi:hypothetical protein